MCSDFKKIYSLKKPVIPPKRELQFCKGLTLQPVSIAKMLSISVTFFS